MKKLMMVALCALGAGSVAAGGIVQGAVTSKTRYLVAGENTGATKTEKARKLGTEVIDEARLLELLGQGRG